MFRPSDHEIQFIGLFLESFFLGLYSGIFAMYLLHQASKKDTNTTQNVIFSSMCALYVLSVVSYVCDMTACTCISRLLRDIPQDLLHRIIFTGTTSFGCSDFIAQCILIYRCWIVWGRNTRVVIIPSILTLTFLATWLLYSISLLLTTKLVIPEWGRPVFLTSLAISLTVNTLVTGLIVFKIFQVVREVKATSDDNLLGSTGGSKLWPVILVIIESRTILFSIQLVRFVVTIVWTEDAYRAFHVIFGIHQMLNGITPTIILVRTSMGLSFRDEKSMEEIGSLRFASSHPDLIPETGNINTVSWDSRDDDHIDVRDIDIGKRRI